MMPGQWKFFGVSTTSTCVIWALLTPSKMKGVEGTVFIRYIPPSPFSLCGESSLRQWNIGQRYSLTIERYLREGRNHCYCRTHAVSGCLRLSVSSASFLDVSANHSMTEGRVEFQALTAARFSPFRVTKRVLVTSSEDFECVLPGLQDKEMRE